MLKRWLKNRQTRRVAELQSEIESLRRQLKVSESERESLALVIARDRERIKSELAAYAKATAEGEKP